MIHMTWILPLACMGFVWFWVCRIPSRMPSRIEQAKKMAYADYMFKKEKAKEREKEKEQFAEQIAIKVMEKLKGA